LVRLFVADLLWCLVLVKIGLANDGVVLRNLVNEHGPEAHDEVRDFDSHQELEKGR
jgi:hypothetical protein